MKRKRDDSDSHTEIASLRGAPPVAAYYREAELAHHRDNPLQEALDPIPSEQDWAIAIGNYIDFDPSIRAASIHIRRQALERVRALVQPQSMHIRAALNLDCLLRAGYIARNPYQNGQIRLMPVMPMENTNSLDERQPSNYNRDLVRAHRREMLDQALVRGMAVLGPSGMGKSTLFRSILLNYPQVIRHNSYKGQEFMFQQIVWMMLECPHNGSRKQLIVKMFHEIDALIGTNYRQSHAKGEIDAYLIPNLERVNAVLRIGIIVIDEVQRLAHAHATSATEMLEFLVQFSNTVRIPIVLTGTNLASSIITSAMQQIRRVSAYGDIYWPMPREIGDDGALHPDWHILLKMLFRYQYVRNPVDLNGELSAALFEKTQGITDLVVTLFILAQERAMREAKGGGDETLTPQLIRETADDEFKVLMPALRALQTKQSDALDKFEDLRSLFNEQRIGQPALNEQETINIQAILESALNTPPTMKAATAVNGNSQAKADLPAANESVNPPQPAAKIPPRKKPVITDPTDLRSCKSDVALTPKGAHERWQKKGFTSSANDYISSESSA
jgi:hypothetical protein